MLGRIIGIEENLVSVELNMEQIPKEIMNLHVILDDGRQVIGEIVDVKDGIAYVMLLGELKGDQFVFGVIKKPSFQANISFVPKDKIETIIGLSDYLEERDLYIGKSPIYDDVNIGIHINDFFSRHFAVFGSTGSGKSCSIARILQNLFGKKEKIPYRSSLFIFDAYGEYHTAFSKLHETVPAIHFKSYTTDIKSNQELVRIPLWLLGVDDIALLLGAEKHSQLLLIEKALKLVTVFARNEDEVLKTKNDIIARAILDILSSGRSPAQIRDQIFSVLSYYNTKELNLETPIFQPGYTRPLKQCIMIDSSGKIREMEMIVDFIETYLTDDYDLALPDGSFPYTLKDLQDAFDFALISEGVLKSDKIYDEANILKVRLHALVASDDSAYFTYPEYIDRTSYIKKLLTADDGKKAQIINFDINYVDDRFAKNLTKIYSKLLFDFSKSSVRRASMPFHIILEEAHRYVQNDNDKFLLGYNIFERITKEGRKYGVLLGLISQRPSELSETSLSQCSNFLIFKMLHPNDVDYIKEMVPNVTQEVIKRLRILQPGTCVAFGSAFKVPVLVKMDMPSPAPSSSSCDVSASWFIEKE